MKSSPTILPSSILAAFAVAMAVVSYSPGAHANVYATNIKLNGSLSNVTSAVGGSVAISYILNESADLGITINILSNATTINSISIPGGSAGSLRGLNTVAWGGTNTSGANVPAGTYSVSIAAAASGFTNWTQTSIDTNSGMPAHYALGIDVNKNTNSPYYGRVVMGCALHTGTVNVPPDAMKTGLFKMNADGTQADEGWYGNAGYLADDAGDAPVASQMPDSGGFDPMKIRIGDDDRIYWLDNSEYGAIIACDMLATTNQIVITSGSYAGPFGSGLLGGPNNYSGNPDVGDIRFGFQEFDVAFTATTNAVLFLCDNDFPNWGIWMYHMTNGAADPTDTVGTKVLAAGGDVSLVTSGGCMVDNNLDIFVGQSRFNINSLYDAMVFTNWNGGVLPPEGGAYTYQIGTTPNEVSWGYGSDVNQQNQVANNDPTFESVRDMVVNSRANPTILACPCSAGGQATPGIRLLNATNGSVIAVTNGASVQVMTNLDWGQAYTCAAWDNVGNLYAASTSLNLWRVWSPPGTNQATTVAVAKVAIVPVLRVTSISVSGGSATIHFSADSGASAGSFTLLSSATVNGTYAPAAGANVTGSGGAFTATVPTSGNAQFYRIKQ